MMERRVGKASQAHGIASICLEPLPANLDLRAQQPIHVRLGDPLAVDRRHQGRGLGCGLLRDAAKRALSAADAIGARALIVQAINQEAKRFYERFGFTSFAKEPLMMLLRMSELKAALRHLP